MDRSLWLLLRLRGWAWFRRWFRSVRTLKGAMLALLGTLVFLPMIVSVFVAPRFMIATQLDLIGRHGPLLLLAYCLLNVLISSGDRAIYYSPAEVNFLFCGPYRPRQLLIYKVIAGTLAALVTALVMACVFAHHAAMFVAAYAGLFVSLMLMYLFTLSVGLAINTLGALTVSRGRKFLLLALGVIAALAVWPIGRELSGLSFWEILTQAERSPVVSVAVGPFRPFINAFTARRIWPDLVAWASLSLLIDLTLLVLVLTLNAQFLEAAATASARVYERIQRARQGHVWTPEGKARVALPMIPWLGGIGPNFWRQMTTISRSPPIFLAMAMLFVLPVVLTVLVRDPGDVSMAAPLSVFLGVALFAPSVVSCDFRNDLRRMEDLKTLPIRPSRLALGQIMTPIILLSLSEWTGMAWIFLQSRSVPTIVMAFATALIVPVNLLLVALENLYFLWYPFRVAGANSFDFQTIGRQILTMMAKGASAFVVALVTGGVSWLVYSFAGESWTATIAAAALVVTASGLILIPFLAQAFEQFDVARDTPPD